MEGIRLASYEDIEALSNHVTNEIESVSSEVKGVVVSKAGKTGKFSDLVGTPSFHKVATTGSYNDLTNKPIIPAKVTKTSELTNDSTFITQSTIERDMQRLIEENIENVQVIGNLRSSLNSLLYDMGELKNRVNMLENPE